ncbi:MAG: hypothetical protein GWP02_09040, partial [Desulfobulbaceae bacterium]|nr:hypothetical protein [Desulfobulbaceae bacterium]
WVFFFDLDRPVHCALEFETAWMDLEFFHRFAVAHDQFRQLGETGIRSFGKKTSVLYDIKYILPPDAVDDRL